MLPTPAPSSPPSSPKVGAVTAEGHEDAYPTPPKNRDSAPFHVLAALFDKLQTERKPEKRRKLLNSWFNVCIEHVVIRFASAERRTSLRIALERRERVRSISCAQAYSAPGKYFVSVETNCSRCSNRKTASALFMGSERRTSRRRTSGSSPSA